MIWGNIWSASPHHSFPQLGGGGRRRPDILAGEHEDPGRLLNLYLGRWGGAAKGGHPGDTTSGLEKLLLANLLAFYKASSAAGGALNHGAARPGGSVIYVAQCRRH